MAVSMADIEAVVTADITQFDSAMTTSGQKVDDLGTKGTAAGANFGAASAVMAGGALAIGAGIAGAVSAAGDFQSSMNEIGAVTGATAEQMTGLSDVALQVGMDTSFSAQQGAQAIAELGKAGIPISDIMNGAAMATAQLAAAGGVDMPRAAEVMSNAMNSFGLSGGQAADVADTLAAASNASASDVNSLAMGLSQVAPSARGLGLSLEETVAQLALFSNYGMQGSDAGTSFKTMIASLTPATKAAREEFVNLGLTTADTANAFFDAQGNFVGMEQATNLLYEALAPLTDEQRLVAEETLFGSDASRAAEITFQAQKAAVEGTAAGYSDLLGAVEPAGQATDVANAKMAGMNGALEALRGSVETAQIAFGTAFLPVVEQVADGLTTLVNMFLALDPQMQSTISVVAAGAAGFLAVGSAIGFIIGPLGAAAAAAGPVAVGIAAIVGPLALVVAGLAALKVAYDQNLGGFADAANQAATDITTAFQPILTVVAQVVEAFQTGGPLAAIQELVASMPAIQGALSNLAGVFGDLAARAIPALVDAFRSIDWPAVGDAIGTGIQGALGALSNFGAWVLAALTGGAGGGGGAGSLAGDITGWIAARFSEIDWPQLGTALVSGATRAVALFLDFSQWGFDRLSEIVTWVMSAITGADWASIGSELMTKGQELVTGLLTGIQDTSDTVMAEFNTIGTQIAGALPDALTLLLSKGTDLLTGLLQGITDKWPDIESWFTDLGPLIDGKLADFGTLLLAHGSELIGGLFQGITEKWPEVDTWLAGLGQDAADTVGELGETLLAAGTALLAGLKSGIDAKWPEIDTWLAALPQDAIDTVGDLVATLTPAGTALLTGLQTGITDFWTGTVQPWLVSVPTLVTTAVGDLGETLKTAGAALLDGLRLGALDVWNNVLGPWMQALPGEMVAALGDLSGALFTAGQSIMQGFIDGIGSMKDGVTGAITDAAGGLITGAQDKLDSHSPSKVFHRLGVNIGEGLVGGIDNGASDVSAAGARMAHDAITAASKVVTDGDATTSTAFQIGQGFGTDFAEGILNQLSKVQGAAAQLAHAAAGAAGGSFDQATSDEPTARAAGGPVASGLSYWVGERGPEIFTPSRSGSITPNGAAMGMAGGGGLSLTIQTLNLPGVQDAEAFVDAMRDLMQQSGVATGRGVS